MPFGGISSDENRIPPFTRSRSLLKAEGIAEPGGVGIGGFPEFCQVDAGSGATFVAQAVLNEVHRCAELVHRKGKRVAQLLNVRNAQVSFADVGDGLLTNRLTVGAVTE